MTRILGYADRVSATPGETIRFMVSCDNIDRYDAELVRVGAHTSVQPSRSMAAHQVRPD